MFKLSHQVGKCYYVLLASILQQRPKKTNMWTLPNNVAISALKHGKFKSRPYIAHFLLMTPHSYKQKDISSHKYPPINCLTCKWKLQILWPRVPQEKLLVPMVQVGWEKGQWALSSTCCLYFSASSNDWISSRSFSLTFIIHPSSNGPLFTCTVL